ncbi:hypothetical protein Tco_0511648 [Tanacetum coccineum]
MSITILHGTIIFSSTEYEPFSQSAIKSINLTVAPTINQEDVTQGSEPTETMMKFQSAKALEGTDAGNGSNKVINVGDVAM